MNNEARILASVATQEDGMSEPLIQVGDFTLNSGAKSKWKLVCDQFIQDNLAGLVELVWAIVGPYCSVDGVPRGGCLLADALRTFTVSGSEQRLIVEDVVTTGGSMERFRDQLIKDSLVKTPYYLYRGVTVFARGKAPEWVRAIFQLPKELWLPGK